MNESERRRLTRGFPIDPQTGLINYGWVRDPTVKAKFAAGVPPKGHVQRCQSKQRDGQQCQQWAIKGRDFCKRHGGRRGLGLKYKTLSYYSKHAGPALRELLKQSSEESPDKRHSLAEEIDLARIVAERAVKTFEMVCISPPEGAEISQSSRAMAVELVQQSLTHVSDIVTKAAKVRAVHEATFDVEQMDYVILKVMEVLERHFSGQPEKLQAAVDDLRGIAMPERKKHRQPFIVAAAEDVRKALAEMEEAG